MPRGQAAPVIQVRPHFLLRLLRVEPIGLGAGQHGQLGLEFRLPALAFLHGRHDGLDGTAGREGARQPGQLGLEVVKFLYELRSPPVRILLALLDLPDSLFQGSSDDAGAQDVLLDGLEHRPVDVLDGQREVFWAGLRAAEPMHMAAVEKLPLAAVGARPDEHAAAAVSAGREAGQEVARFDAVGRAAMQVAVRVSQIDRPRMVLAGLGLQPGGVIDDLQLRHLDGNPVLLRSLAWLLAAARQPLLRAAPDFLSVIERAQQDLPDAGRGPAGRPGDRSRFRAERAFAVQHFGDGREAVAGAVQGEDPPDHRRLAFVDAVFDMAPFSVGAHDLDVVVAEAHAARDKARPGLVD